MKSPEVTKRCLSPKQVSQRYPFSVGTLANWRWKKQGPLYYHVGRKVVYLVEDIESWLFRSPVFTVDSIPDKKRTRF